MLKGQSFPLIFLMLLVAFAAILARIAMPLVQAVQQHGIVVSEIASDVLVSWGIGTVIVGMLCGFVVGWVRENVLTGLTMGVVLGGVVGAACAPLLVIPAALTALFDLAWLFISLLILTSGTILIERHQARKRKRESYAEVLDEVSP